MKNRLFRPFLLIVLMAFVISVQAASVLPLGLERIMGDATTVFNGRCISNQVEQDSVSNMVVTFTTFEILESIKGEVGITHTIKQLGGRLPSNEIHMEWPGIPKFTVGEEYIVFLPTKSSQGFSSPIGLQQGQFSVRGGAAGKEVSNGKGFQELIKNVPLNQIPDAVRARISAPPISSATSKTIQSFQTPAPNTKLGLDDFLTIIRGMAAP